MVLTNIYYPPQSKNSISLRGWRRNKTFPGSAFGSSLCTSQNQRNPSFSWSAIPLETELQPQGGSNTERNVLGAKQSQVKKCGHLTQARNINAGLEQFEVKYYSRFNSQTRTLNKQLIAYNRHFGLRQGNKMLRVSKPTILLDSSNLLLASIQILLSLSNPVLRSRGSLVEIKISCQ